MTTDENGVERTETMNCFGSLQRSILSALVAADEPIPAAEVRERLAARGVDRAHSTVNTELGRLHEQGVLEREREEYPGGFRYRYVPIPGFKTRHVGTHLDAIGEVLGSTGFEILCEQLRAREACCFDDE